MNAACVRRRIRSAIGSITRSGWGSANASRMSGIAATARAIASDSWPARSSILSRACQRDTAKPALTVRTMIATWRRRICVDRGRSLRHSRGLAPVTTGILGRPRRPAPWTQRTKRAKRRKARKRSQAWTEAATPRTLPRHRDRDVAARSMNPKEGLSVLELNRASGRAADRRVGRARGHGELGDGGEAGEPARWADRPVEEGVRSRLLRESADRELHGARRQVQS